MLHEFMPTNLKAQDGSYEETQQVQSVRQTALFVKRFVH